MGTQQLLLIIIGIIIIGIAIAGGIYLFNGNSISSNKDAIINDLMNLGQYAYRYRLRPEPLGGGGRSFTGFALPQKLQSSDDASFSVNPVTPSAVTFTAVSKFGYGSIVAGLDSSGTI